MCIRDRCTAEYSGDHADACRRPGRPSDAVTAGTSEYLPTRDTADNDRPTAVDRQENVGNTCQALTDAATDRSDAYSAEPPNCSNTELSLQNDDTTRSDIHGKLTFNKTDRNTETGQTRQRKRLRTTKTETRQTERECTDNKTDSVKTTPPPQQVQVS